MRVCSDEAWMRTSKYREGPNSDFILLGHSLGAYLSVLFALKFPAKIKKLILMSPIGLLTKPDDWDLDEKIIYNMPPSSEVKETILSHIREQ